jgi:hypothetical protein
MARMQWNNVAASPVRCHAYSLTVSHLPTPCGACADQILYDSFWYRVFTRRVLHCTAIFTGQSCTEIKGSYTWLFLSNSLLIPLYRVFRGKSIVIQYTLLLCNPTVILKACSWTISRATECSIHLQTLLISRTRFNVIRQYSPSVPSGSLLLSVSVACMHFSLLRFVLQYPLHPNNIRRMEHMKHRWCNPRHYALLYVYCSERIYIPNVILDLLFIWTEVGIL